MKRAAIARTGGPTRRTRLRSRSLARGAQRAERAAVVAALGLPACSLSGFGPQCSGPWDAHELVARGVRPGAHLERDLVVWLCRAHHELVTVDPVLGERVGARIESWAYDKWGATVLREAQIRRAVAGATGRVAGGAGRWREWEPTE